MPPVFAHGSLRLYLLSLLDDGPKHGYELIQALSNRFGGTYSPSAGTIYPRLAKLEDEGLVVRTADGRRSVYALTDAGRAELAERADELADIEQDVSETVRSLADQVRAGVDEAMKSLRAELAAAARERPWADEPSRDGAFVGDPADGDDAATASAAAAAATLQVARGALQRADVVLARFRADTRAELRRGLRGGALTDDVADELETRLDAVHQWVRTTMRG